MAQRLKLDIMSTIITIMLMLQGILYVKFFRSVYFDVKEERLAQFFSDTRYFISGESSENEDNPISSGLQDYSNWMNSSKKFCSGNFELVSESFAVLTDVAVMREHFDGKEKGGENISDVMGQKEKVEYLKLNPGAFKINCSKKGIGIPLSFVQVRLESLVDFPSALKYLVFEKDYIFRSYSMYCHSNVFLVSRYRSSVTLN